MFVINTALRTTLGHRPVPLQVGRSSKNGHVGGNRSNSRPSSGFERMPWDSAMCISSFLEVFYCPGNHDLWLHNKDMWSQKQPSPRHPKVEVLDHPKIDEHLEDPKPTQLRASAPHKGGWPSRDESTSRDESMDGAYGCLLCLYLHAHNGIMISDTA